MQSRGRGYFASLGVYVFAGFLGLAFARTALVDSFGVAGRQFRGTFIGLMHAVPTLFFVLPIAISIWWQKGPQSWSPTRHRSVEAITTSADAGSLDNDFSL